MKKWIFVLAITLAITIAGCVGGIGEKRISGTYIYQSSEHKAVNTLELKKDGTYHFISKSELFPKSGFESNGPYYIYKDKTILLFPEGYDYKEGLKHVSGEADLFILLTAGRGEIKDDKIIGRGAGLLGPIGFGEAVWIKQ